MRLSVQFSRLLLICHMAGVVFGQQLLWQTRCLQNPAPVSDRNGNIILATSNGPRPLTTTFVKFSPSGTIVWSNSVPFSFNSFFSPDPGVTGTDDSGNFLVAGQNTNRTRMKVVKIDASG